MGNLFKEVTSRAGDLVSYPVKATKDLITNPSKGIKEWEHLYTHNEHKDQRLFQNGFGIRGWVGDHPQESAAAVVATVFGGWAAWGAYGAGAAGSATAGASGAAGAGAAGSAGGSTIAAGTAIGQTVPAIPSVASMTSGTGAAVTASPSYSILAAPGYGTGGSYATTLGGEVPVANTGFTGSSGSSWFDRAKQIQQLSNQKGQGQDKQGQAAQPEKFLNNSAFDYLSRSKPLYENPTDTATDVLNGLKLNSEQNGTPDFTHGGTFGGFN
ncbi:hypothetical protein L8P30_09940 [Enterobacter asburiae]|uniref:hypothetical protein n=1 Tax=Enterobacter asburiae TaxID=61645 RepID=UPI002003EE80|nr:hypothetical protein [Enterobacter asburiae]MCK7142571.1 hypothetical protein [Enterobacter asburiae]